MDQNQRKSVWLRLVLPICLGVFATAIYYNAIKTQKDIVVGFVASRDIEVGDAIEIENWDEAFESRTLAYHVSSAEKTKSLFDAKKIKAVLSGSKIIINRNIKEGDPVSVYDFEPSN